MSDLQIAAKTLIRTYYTTFNTGDREAMLELLTEAKCEDAVHLTGVRSVGMHPEVCWFVMELLVGQDLESLLLDDAQV